MTHRISQTVDVGAAGVFVETISPSKEGTPLSMRVPELGDRELHGVVVRTTARGMAVELDHRQGWTMVS